MKHLEFLIENMFFEMLKISNFIAFNFLLGEQSYTNHVFCHANLNWYNVKEKPHFIVPDDSLEFLDCFCHRSIKTAVYSNYFGILSLKPSVLVIREIYERLKPLPLC